MKFSGKIEKTQLDLLICFAALGTFFWVSASLDLGERWEEWSDNHEDWELDEVLVALGASSILLSWYSLRRWFDLREETKLAAIANQKLQDEISRRQTTEISLRESETRLVQASHLAKIGYHVWDVADKNCIFCSEEHAKIHGVTPAEFVARCTTIDSLLFFMLPEDAAIWRGAILDLTDRKSIDVQYRAVTPTGEVRFVRQLAKPIFNDAGEMVQILGTSQDLTEVRIVEDELRQAQKMEAVGQLTAGVAHKFNNILAIIMGNAELLEEKLNEKNNALSNIISASTQGAELTQRLLSFSKQQHLSSKNTDLADLLEKLNRTLLPVLGEKWRLKTIFDPLVGFACVDPRQLEIALTNLIENSIESMPDGGVIQIECADYNPEMVQHKHIPKLESLNFIVVLVTDTGCGMSQDIQDKVFDPFHSSKGFGEKAGLGLSMVYGFVKQSGGDIYLSSEVDMGTCVTLILPRIGGGVSAS